MSSDLSGATFEELVAEMIRRIGEDPDREGLKRTPERVAKSLAFLTRGYGMEFEDVVNGALFDDCHQNMVLVKDIEMYSLCEHHLLPFFGKVHVAYIPNGKIVGLSKIARLVDVYARRLQVQERMTEQIAQAIWEGVEPGGRGRRSGGLPSVHDDAGCAEAELENDHLRRAGLVSRGPDDARRVSASLHDRSQSSLAVSLPAVTESILCVCTRPEGAQPPLLAIEHD